MLYVRRNLSSILWLPAFVALGCTGIAQQSAHGQNSIAGWPDQSYQRIKSQPVAFNNRSAVLRAGTFAGDEEKKFEEFYTQSLFPNVTNEANRQSPRDDVVLKLRSDFRICERAAANQVFDKLVDLTLDFMAKIAKDNQYHPVARMNAMLAIGEVNSPKAIDLLLATVADNSQLDAVRVAAMSDLIHLAGQSAMASPEVAQPVIKRVKTLAGFHTKDGPRADWIRWMRGQAADILAALGSTGTDNDVPSALLVMVSEKELPIPLRCKAARALSKLNYGGNPPAATPFLVGLVELARDAFSSDQPADRGRVRQVARDVLDGLKPFASSTSSTDQILTEGLQKTLQGLNKETESSLKPVELKAAIDKAKVALDSLLKNKK
jgi:hypothetical protein